jgi:ATP-dependent helicase HrpB
VQAAAQAARAAAAGNTTTNNRGAGAGRGGSIAGSSGVRGGSGGGAGSSSAYSSFEGFEVDRAAAKEAGLVAAQLLSALGRLARNEEGGEWCASGVGEGNPTGPVFDFLLGQGANESGVLLAMVSA